MLEVIHSERRGGMDWPSVPRLDLYKSFFFVFFVTLS